MEVEGNVPFLFIYFAMSTFYFTFLLKTAALKFFSNFVEGKAYHIWKFGVFIS